MLRPSKLPRAAAVAVVLAAALAAGPAAAQYQTSFGKNKVQYREFDWKIYHSPHFDIYYYEDEEPLLEKVVSFAESAYDRLSREFDHQVENPIPLVFYATHSAFEQNNIILNFIPEGIGAFASPARNRMVLPVDLPDAELFQLVSHELTHVFQYSLLFGDRLGRGLSSMRAPQWFTEGMASYMADDEGTADKMFLRDAVVNDRIPSILQRGVSGFIAYRFGHAAFDFIEERWGRDGFRDFLYEFRNTLGSRPERALERALKIEPEDFDLDFRRWLRRKYLPQLVETGEPSDFGRPFRDEEGKIVDVISPAASPSGDLVAALAVTRGDLDIVLYDARKRRPIANLTKGFTGQYEYITSQYVTSKARMGRDLAFSPDGNRLAVFVKREEGRSLAIFDVLERKLERMVPMEIEQQNSPAFSPDGGKVVFSGNTAGRFDIFSLDLATSQVVNLTNDERYDGAPVYSPDGASIVYSSMVGEDHGQLFQLDLADPARRTQLTRGDWTDKDAVFSSDGSWLVFTSDRSGADNIWAMELASGRVHQLTDAVTGCLMPTVLRGDEGRDRVVYTGLWNGDFDLYVEELDKAVAAAVEPAAGAAPAAEPPAAEPPAAGTPGVEPPAETPVPVFEPDIRVTLDDANKSDYGGFKLFLEDGGGTVGVSDDQVLLGQAFLSFSDYLGDRRLQVVVSTVDTFSDFDIQYLDLSGRSYWGLRLFDYRDYYVLGQSSEFGILYRQELFRMTALVASWGYPFSLYHRVELGAGAYTRKYTLPALDPVTGDLTFVSIKDDFVPMAEAALTGDSSVSTRWGPIDGGRWRLSTQFGYDTEEGGTLDWRSQLDARRYIQVSERTNLALRLFAGYAEGNRPSLFFLGGLDTLRGFDYRSVVGDRAFVANLEYRFPLIDALVGPFFDFRGIRGRLFLDVGGAWYDQLGQDFEFWDSDQNRLADGLSSYGWGVTIRFGGLDLNWDFSRRWDFKDEAPGGFSTSFWIGSRF